MTVIRPNQQPGGCAASEETTSPSSSPKPGVFAYLRVLSVFVVDL